MEYEIEGYPGYYLYITVNDVKVLSSKCRNKIIPNQRKEMSFHLHKKGYLALTLNNNGNKKRYLLHRLVAENLIPNPNNLKSVDHIDGNKLNNHPSNLEWVSLEENTSRAHKMGIFNQSKTYKIKYKTGEEIIIHNLKEFSKKNNYNYQLLNGVARGRRKTHKNIISVQEVI